MGTKQDVITEIFGLCRDRKNFTFDNTLVKQVCKKVKSQVSCKNRYGVRYLQKK